MKKILVLCIFLFSIALSYGGSLTPETAEKNKIENAIVSDFHTMQSVLIASPVIIFKVTPDIDGQPLGVLALKKTKRYNNPKLINRGQLSIFYTLNLINKNSNSYSLILNYTSGGLSEREV